MVAPVVGEEDANTVAEAIYDAGTDDMTKAISIELELSSELKNKHGKVWNSMLAAVSREIEGKHRFMAMTEDERASYANTVAKHFADQVLAEANYRGTTLDAILRDSDIVYDNGIKLKRHINLFDALKNPEMIPPETKLRKKGMHLIQFLRSRGGIIDEGGDLKSREADKQYIGLINKNGMTLDDAALLAWQEGYLPNSEFNYGRPDINALLDAIDEGLRGHHRYNVVEETATFKDALKDLAFQLENIGIDWKNMTAAEIEKAVNEIPEMESLQREAEFYANYEPEIGMSEDEAERFAIETEGKEYPVIDEKDLPERYYQIADENAKLDAENPAYDGETININGVDKTVYNSDGERIAQSEAALRNFYNWFGDSKVVDEQGRPLVVYHGTYAEFNNFNKNMVSNYSAYSKNFYFTENKQRATDYGNKILSVYLKSDNLFDVELNLPTREDIEKINKILAKDGLKLEGDYGFNGMYMTGENFLNDLGVMTEQDYDYLLKEIGYDGIKSKDEFIVFNPNQIKSTSNRGTYSESENIYYQREISDEELEADLAEFDKILDSFAEENKEYYNKKGKFEDAKKIQKKYQNYFMYNIADASNPRGIHDPFYFEYDGKKDITNIWTPKKLEKSSNIILYRGAEQIFIPVNEFDESKFKKLGFKRQKVFDEGLRDIYTENKEEKSDYLRDFERIDGKYVRKPETYYQSAFAGSRVDYDRPSLEAIGSGEGHAAHGWGLYYALNRDVAEGYRRAFLGAKYNGVDWKDTVIAKYDQFIQDALLSGDKTKQEKIIAYFENSLTKEQTRLNAYLSESTKNMSNSEKKERKLHIEAAQEQIKKLTPVVDFVKSFDISKLKTEGGQVHEVDIPENPYLLDEQKPFSEQSDIVKKGIIDTLNSMNLTEKQKEKFINNIENRRDTGKEIYEELVVAMGTSRGDGLISSSKENMPLVSKALAENGVKGITYFGRQDGRCFVIFNPEDVKVIQKFYQRGKNAKGYTNITPDEYIIKLLEDADESTLPHELAHYWLTEMWNYTRTGRASEKYMKRWQIISDYLGVKPEQTRLTPTQQEKFASSYEAYLTRGELPTPLIGSAFDDYDKWLQRVYNDYNKINYHVKKGKKVYSHPVRLTDAAIKFFQSMTTGTLEAPALAPKDTGVEVPQTVSAEEVIEPTNEIVETPTTYDTTRVINITEGEKGVSKVFQREAMKHADRIVDELGVSYNKINLEEQAIKAAEWVQNNLDEAREVVNGKAAPEGIIDTAIFIAYENEMLRIGNNAEYQRALKIHSQVQTQRGQAIAAERISTDDVYNPAYWWKKLQKNKENDVARKLFKGDTEALNKMIENETKSIMKQIAGKPKEEQVEALTKLAEKLQKDYKLDTLYQMPDDVNERTVREFIKDTIGVNPDVMAGNEVINKAEQLQKLWENTKDSSGNPSVEAMRAKRELNDLIQAQTPSNALAIWTSIFGRGIMLTSVKSPVLNIISNIEAGFTEGITRRLMYGTTEKAVDKTVKEEFSKYAWEVYKASADIVTTMNDYDDDMRIIGEQILHSQGPGAFRAASRKVEEVSFKYLMGAPDAVAKTLAFNDTADLLATKIAKEEGAKDISKRATEIYKDAILIKPETEQGQYVREQAQAQAHYTTFTNDSWAARFGLSARNWLNMVGRNKIRLGDLTMKFVKTPANVQMMGLEYGFGSLYTLYNVQEIIKNPQSETSQIAIRAAVRNGLGIALAALLYSMLDPDDYFSEFDTLNPKEKDRMRAMGAMPNSIKIGNRWVSLDYFGQLGIPLVGMLEARRNNGLRSYIQSGLTQAAKIPGIKETKQLIDNMSEYARYDLKPEKIAQMMAGTVLDQARAMTIPAIVNDIAKMTDDYERDTMGGVMDKVISSIPGLRQTLPERYGIQGLVRTEPALSTLLFGSRVKTEQSDKLVREVEKLAGKAEQPSISDVTKYGDLRLLSPEKKVKVRKEFYKAYNAESKKLISTREYQKKSPEDKKKALNKVRSRVVKSLKEKYNNDIQREKRRR